MNLAQYAVTDKERRIAELFNELGKKSKVADVIGCTRQNVIYTIKKLETRASKMGDGKHFLGDSVPNGYEVKGTSTLYDADGQAKIQWVKTNQSDVDKLKALREAVSDIIKDTEGKATPSPVPAYTDEDQMTVYTIGDAHIGMLAHRYESGDDFDVKVAEHDLKVAMKRLVVSAPCSDTAMIVDVGDFFHSDNQSNETSHSGNKLDVDGRWFKVLKVGLTTMVELVNEALRKHNKVIVKNAIGNHNEHSAIYLSLFLSSWFRNEPRVHVDESPNIFWYYKFGKVLIGVTHGHTVKMQELGEIMAADCEEMWSESKYRYWLTGHVHHDQSKEYRTCKVESFRTLASKDAWHNSKGYRSGRDMKCIVYHKEYGEIQRNTVNVAMIGDEA